MARSVKESENDKTIIKQIMREKGITLEELAKRMDRAKATVSNLLIKGNMTIDTLELIAKSLDVEISDLFPVKSGYIHYMEVKNKIMNAGTATQQLDMSDKDMALFQKFKAFMAQENIGVEQTTM